MQNSPSCFICRDSMKIIDHRVSMGNERSQLKASGFWFRFKKLYKDLKRFNVKKLLLSAQ